MKLTYLFLALFVSFFAFSCEHKLDEGIIDETVYYYINSTDHSLTISVKGGNDPIPANKIVDSTVAPGDTLRYHLMTIRGPGDPFMSRDTSLVVTLRFSGTTQRCLEFQGMVTDSAADIRHFLAYNKVPAGYNANWNAYFAVTNDHFNKSGICK